MSKGITEVFPELRKVMFSHQVFFFSISQQVYSKVHSQVWDIF